MYKDLENLISNKLITEKIDYKLWYYKKQFLVLDIYFENFNVAFDFKINNQEFDIYLLARNNESRDVLTKYNKEFLTKKKISLGKFKQDRIINLFEDITLKFKNIFSTTITKEIFIKNNFLKKEFIDYQNLYEATLYLMAEIHRYKIYTQKISKEDNIDFRILFKENDFSTLKTILNNFTHNQLRIFLDNPSDSLDKKIINAYFYDKEHFYLGFTLQLDPWYCDKKIYTHNRNPYCTELKLSLIEKSLFTSTPKFIKSIDEVDEVDIKDILGIRPSIYFNHNFPIDVVYTWVDGQDEEWLRKKNQFLGNFEGHKEDAAAQRFEQINELKYSLRSIAYYFKQFRKIFVVTDQQVPSWLDKSHPCIEIIDHSQIFGVNQGKLPVFNSHAIEANLHNIPGLSEHFIYLNDDFMLWNRVNKSDFFKANGLSISRLNKGTRNHGDSSSELPAWRNAALNANKLLANKFDMQAFSFHLHCPYTLKRSVMNNMWKDFSEALTQTTSSRFRSHQDISPVSFLYHAYAFRTGQSVLEENISNVVNLNTSNSNDLDKLERQILTDTNIKFLCLNDAGKHRQTERVISCLEKKFPQSANWEKKF